MKAERRWAGLEQERELNKILLICKLDLASQDAIIKWLLIGYSFLGYQKSVNEITTFDMQSNTILNTT